MGGVDMADPLRKAYSCKRRSRKWWLPLFYFMVDISVVNSYILHRDTPPCAKLTLKEFILELAAELISSHSARKRSADPSLDAPPSARFWEAFPIAKQKKGPMQILQQGWYSAKSFVLLLGMRSKRPCFPVRWAWLLAVSHKSLTSHLHRPPLFHYKLRTFLSVFPYSLCITPYN